MKSPYRHADIALYALFAMMSREFQNLSTKLRDDMTVDEVRALVVAMYLRMDNKARNAFLTEAESVRKDTEEEIKARESRWSALEFLIAMLGAYDPVTKYVYTAEWERKRDRLVEGLMASSGKQARRVELKRAMDVLSLQFRQYADNITDAVRIDVFEGAGVDRVMWNTQRDERVCGTCADRDRVVYEVDSIPVKHYRCRCYLTAVGERSGFDGE